jgi:hypothetical protein
VGKAEQSPATVGEALTIQTLRPLISLSRIAITAITRSTWIMFPTLNTNAPSNHPMIRIMAMTYNRSLMIKFFNSGHSKIDAKGIQVTEGGVEPISESMAADCGIYY